jgi:hypothetical protein
MATYAAGTEVSTDRSMAEIRRTLQRWGATQFMWGESGEQSMVAFQMRGRQVRFVVPMPDKEAKEFKWTNHASPRRRTVNQQIEAYEQAVRQRWRALNLVIKAKLEAVEAQISTFEAEFLANTVLPNGRTVAEEIEPDIAHAYETQQMPELLPQLKAIEA